MIENKDKLSIGARQLTNEPDWQIDQVREGEVHLVVGGPGDGVNDALLAVEVGRRVQAEGTRIE